MRVPQINNTILGHVLLIGIWWAAYKSADLFGFFDTFASLWFLPAGVTLAIVLSVPTRFLLAPLLANLLLAIPLICAMLGIEFTNYRDPMLHSLRLYAVYGGLGLLLRFGLKLPLPVGTLEGSHWKLGLTLVTAAMGALSGVSLHAAVGNFPWSVAWDIIRPWGVGDAIGAVIVPPLLVPFLLAVFPDDGRTNQSDWNWPSPVNLLAQITLIVLAMVIGFIAPRFYPDLFGLWYVILLPPVLFALQGGLPSAATSVFLTTMLAPPIAHTLAFDGEKLSLQFLLLVSSLVGLTIGSAITDRKRAFAAVKRNERDLEDQVKERTAKLEEAHGFQKHLLRSLGHDLKQPVQSINLMLDSLASELKDNPKAQSVEKAKHIGSSAADFVNKMLEYAKRDAGRVDVDLQQVQLSEILELLTITYEPMASAKDVNLKIQPSMQYVLTDSTLLFEALSNLVDNSVRLSSRSQIVAVNVEQSDQWISISITDEIKDLSGEGIKQTGFGLEIVSQISSMIGAQFDQQPNKSTIRLPRNGL
ncbi:MAG: ATP-binding protein [Rhizobiaceae bacterium]